jgi:UDP-N-acetylmuramate--alanine ligase
MTLATPQAAAGTQLGPGQDIVQLAAQLAEATRVHIVGIAGTGTSGLARILRQRGYLVTGSDARANAVTDELERDGIRVFIGQRAENVDFARGLVVISAAVPDGNPEVAAARELGIPIAKYAAVVAALAASRKTIAIAGCHGKTTTTAMTAYLLRRCGVDCGFLVGGRVPQLQGSAGDGKAWDFVVEACEYDRSFLNLTPALAAVTNLDADHLDYYGSVEAIRAAFAQFVLRIREGGMLVSTTEAWRALAPLVEADPQWSAKRARVRTVGYERGDSLRIVGIPPAGRTGRGVPCPAMRLQSGPYDLGAFQLAIPGEHNLVNAAIAISLALESGCDLERLRGALPEFLGVDRRLTERLRTPHLTILDDYGHHPTELRATLEAVRRSYLGDGRFAGDATGSIRGRLVVVFQPHQYSRTRLLFDDFVDALAAADKVVLPEIYAARDSAADRASVSSEDLAAKLRERGVDAAAFQSLERAAEDVWQTRKDGDVVLTSGAGDVDRVADELVRRAAD